MAALLGAAAAVLPSVADRLPPRLATVARLPERAWTRLVAPRVSGKERLAALTPAERTAVAHLRTRLDGLVVWSSNRSGNHELYRLSLGAGEARQLTHDPRVDFFPRISPDGRRVLFLRSQRDWVSFRDKSAWDVRMMGVDGAHDELLASGGYHSTWAAGGRAVLFERGTRVIRLDLATRAESVVLDWQAEFPGLEEAGDVEMSPDGRRLAFGLRGHFRGAHGLSGAFSGAATLDLDGRTLAILTREQACETTWSPDGASVVWMETGGNGGTRVMTGRPDGTDRRVLIDLPGRHSHEYFPRLSDDGRWLVWGASAEGHEHDRADYEIFVWKLGTPWGDAVRLTHHPGNDQWPDLRIARPR